jgi:hypothetical protein
MRCASALFIVSAIIALAPSASSQDAAIKFRGAYLGQPLSDYVDCSSGKAKSIQKGYRTHGHLCDGKRGVIFHTMSRGLMNPKEDGEDLYFENRSLTTIKIEVPNNDWERIRLDLSAKLGEPTSEAPQEYQNLFGAHWQFDQGFWRKGNLIAHAGIKVGPIDACGGPCKEGIEIVITTPERVADGQANSLD